MVVNVGLVNMRRYDKLMLTSGETHRQFIADFVVLLWRDLTGEERLPYLICDNVPTMLWFSTGYIGVHHLFKQKFRVNSLRRTLILTDIFAVLRLIRIDGIV